MEFPEIKIPIIDMVRGVGELVAEEAQLFFHKVTDHLQHEGISTHASKPEPIHPTDTQQI